MTLLALHIMVFLGLGLVVLLLTITQFPLSLLNEAIFSIKKDK